MHQRVSTLNVCCILLCRKSITSCSLSDLTYLQVTIFQDVSLITAGDSHTVQCTVTDIPYLVVSPTVELIGPGDNVLATDMSLTVTHTLDPVMTSHAGQYTCRASVMIASVSVDVSGQSNSTLTVQSMSIQIILICLCD